MTATNAAGPIAATDRALAPDLARGAMLLFIALANSHYFLQGPSIRGGFPQDTGTLDRICTWLIATFADGRSFPMFGLLFGYGVARIVARHVGPPAATRRLLWRRAGVLVAIGLVDGMFLFVGDILAMYGVLLLVGAWAVGWRDRTLLWVALAFFILCALPGDDSASVSTLPPDASMLSPDLWTQFAERIEVLPVIALLGPIGFACPFLLGLWAGRRRILEQPERHRPLLRWTAAIGIGVAVAGAQPAALMAARVIDVPGPDTLSLVGALHDSTGVFGGLGYAALIALLALRWSSHGPRGQRSSAAVRAVAATGQRSMTSYLAQSVVWCVVFTPYLLGLANTLSVTATALLAALTWLATVVVADRLRAAGRRGPFETLTRRVTYGR